MQKVPGDAKHARRFAVQRINSVACVGFHGIFVPTHPTSHRKGRPERNAQSNGAMQINGPTKIGRILNGIHNNPINLNGQRPQEGVPRREDGHQRKRPKKLQRHPKGQKAKANMQAWTRTELARLHCLPTRWIHLGYNR